MINNIINGKFLQNSDLQENTTEEQQDYNLKLIQMTSLVKKLLKSNNKLRSSITDQNENHSLKQAKVSELQSENLKIRERINQM